MSQTIPNDPFTQELQRIGQWIAAGQLQEAAQALNAAQERFPRDARIALLGVRLADKAGNLRGALQAARRAVALEPGWHVAVMELAVLLARQQEYKEALAQARHAVALQPRSAQVLRLAAAVANQAEDLEQAIIWAKTSLQLAPDDIELRLGLAGMLSKKQQYAEAKQAYEAVLQAQPNQGEALWGLLMCAIHLKDEDEAKRLADIFIIRFPDDERVRYWHAVAHGQTPATQPTSVVGDLFDDYAHRFDLHLVRGLQYKVPQRAAEILLAQYPDRRFNLLDLGCGTGLLGVYLGPIQGFMIGVDLSEPMIAQAARHNLYARFHQVNLLDALRDTPADHYEAIACLDALVYVGDLTPVIPNALRILKPGGCFIFSCETAAEDEADLVLRTGSNRYAHKASAVERACREAGFGDVQIEPLEALRMEGGQPLPGFLVTARKPAATA
ncbi:methyltransferase domain-containing protein [Comamonadaceae bacterium OH2545_COT-014]|nr:methyltransferase domain-containing protein [Comamonadaceae bacterium OH2545_COT-014]